MQFFKHIFLKTLLIAGLVFQACNASASNLRFILGGDYAISDIKYANVKERYKKKNDTFLEVKDDFKSFSPVIGIGAYGISLEAYILNSQEVKKDSLKAKIRAYGFDVIGEAGLSDNFSVVASLGLVEYKFKTQEDKIKNDDESNGPRIGIGLQYYLTHNIAVRAMYHYTILNSGRSDHYKAVSEITAGLRLFF